MTMYETVIPIDESSSGRRRAAGRAALAIVTGSVVLLLVVTTWESLTPYILGLTLAYLLLPLVRWIETRLPTNGWLGRSRHAVATLMTFVVLVIFVAILA